MLFRSASGRGEGHVQVHLSRHVRVDPVSQTRVRRRADAHTVVRERARVGEQRVRSVAEPAGIGDVQRPTQYQVAVHRRQITRGIAPVDPQIIIDRRAAQHQIVAGRYRPKEKPGDNVPKVVGND